MRKLTVKREKSFVGCLGIMKVYVEDAERGDEKLPVYTRNGDNVDKAYISCRKIGELKNGEERTFEIGECAARVFVIADKLSKDYCNDCYQLPEGNEDIYLSGRNKLNPAAGNAFRFDGNDGEAAAEGRKKGVRRGLVILIASVLIGFAAGYGITAAIFAIAGGKEKVFSAGEMSITLNEGFEQEYVVGYSALYSSKDVTIFVNRDGFESGDAPSYSASEYAELIISYNGFESKLISDGELHYFITDSNANDGVAYRNYAYAYKSDSAYWLIQFAVKADKAARYADDIAEWAGSVTFN